MCLAMDVVGHLSKAGRDYLVLKKPPGRPAERKGWEREKERREEGERKTESRPAS